MSKITTHVLDTSRGVPAEGISITLFQLVNEDKWKEIATGITNDDGRVNDLLAKETKLSSGIYRLIFETGIYFMKHNTRGFYPWVTIDFELSENGHYHVPLLLNPYGYSTYRGS